MILSQDRDRGRISLSTKKLEPTPGDMLRNPALVYEKVRCFLSHKGCANLLLSLKPSIGVAFGDLCLKYTTRDWWIIVSN